MKINTHNNTNMETQLARDFKYAGMIRHIGRLDVTSFVINSDDIVEKPYQIADGEILNVYVSFSISRVMFIPQLERDRLIPVTLQDFSATLDAYGAWKEANKGKIGKAGIEEVIWHDPMLPVEFV